MANSFEIIKYKQQIGSMLINCPEIVELINNKDIEEPEDDEFDGEFEIDFEELSDDE